jgi:hypothetical protein
MVRYKYFIFQMDKPSRGDPIKLHSPLENREEDLRKYS